MEDYTKYSTDSLWRLNDAYMYSLAKTIDLGNKQSIKHTFDTLVRIKAVIYSREKQIK